MSIDYPTPTQIENDNLAFSIKTPKIWCCRCKEDQPLKGAKKNRLGMYTCALCLEKKVIANKPASSERTK